MNCGDRATRAIEFKSTSLCENYSIFSFVEMFFPEKTTKNASLILNFLSKNTLSKSIFVTFHMGHFYFIRKTFNCRTKNLNLRYKLAALALAMIAHKAAKATNDFIFNYILIRCARSEDEIHFNSFKSGSALFIVKCREKAVANFLDCHVFGHSRLPQNILCPCI